MHLLFIIIFSLWSLFLFNFYLSLSFVLNEKVKIFLYTKEIFYYYSLSSLNNSSSVLQINNLQESVTTDIDVNWENCAQLVYSICNLLVEECFSKNAIEAWAWILAANKPPFDILDNQDYYEEVIGNTILIKVDNLIPSSQIPQVTNKPSQCQTVSDMIILGRYYYSLYRDILQCDKFVFNLNSIEKYITCSHTDILSKK
ncbi:MAG: hypothetical protein QXW71_03505 [Thermoplasmata archaeon]